MIANSLIRILQHGSYNGGLGSTLIAAEKNAIPCFMMELDPIYVDVIIIRWQNFSGKDAILDGTDKTFKDTEDDRKNTTTGKEERPRKRRRS